MVEENVNCLPCFVSSHSRVMVSAFQASVPLCQTPGLCHQPLVCQGHDASTLLPSRRCLHSQFLAMLDVGQLSARFAALTGLNGPNSSNPNAPSVFTTTVSAVVALLVARELLRQVGEASDPFRMKGRLPMPETTLPVLKNTLDTAKKQRHRLHDWLADQSSLFGARPWMMQVLGRAPTVVLTSPDSFEDVTKRQADNFPRGYDSKFTTRDFLGRGIIATDGRDWFFQRKVSSHLFSMKMMQDVMHDIVREKVAVLCGVLDAYMARAEPAVSLKRELIHFTSDVFAKIGFGIELHCLETGLDGETHEFIEAFSVASHAIEHRLQLPVWLWRFQRFWNLGEEAELKKSMKIVNDFTYDMIARSIAEKSARGDNAEPVKDLVSLFLTTSMAEREEITGGDQKVEMEFIRDMAINFIFAGKDTTSLALSWFVVAMNQHPEVLAKIRDELKEHVPDLFDRSANRIPTIDELKPLVYLEAVIRENLRLNPPAAMAARCAASDTMLSDGTPIKEGTRILLAIYASARQTSVWGPDAAEFKPERWIDPETNSILTVSPFKSINFAAGPRMCPGRHMAMMEMKIALAVLLSRYDFTTVENPWEITYEVAITHVVKGDLMVKVAPHGV